MARYIDADVLLNKVEQYFAGLPIVVHHDMVEFIENAPTAGVVEVVRCKDCKWRDESTCLIHGAIWKDNDFCSMGERREDG